jgi:23S rRNA pseudouridine2605 synthase
LPADRKVGLARALSKLGYCSRSQAFELVRAGRVTLNGRKRLDPETPVSLDRDTIAVDANPVVTNSKLHLMLNKPRGYVTTASDERGRETVYDLLPPNLPWLAPVGRLDKASEGLLLFTNDSEWAATITSPESRLDKTYPVQISCVAVEHLLAKIKRGITSKSEVLRVKSATMLRSGERNSWLEIVLDEGRNRHIRRIFETLNIAVLRLVRVSIGSLQLGDLEKGKCRKLTNAEVNVLTSFSRKR